MRTKGEARTSWGARGGAGAVAVAGGGPRGVSAADVAMAGGEAEHARAAAGDEDRRAAGGEGVGGAVERVDPEVLARVAEGAVGEEPAEHRDVLAPPVDAHLRRVHLDPRAAVIVHLVTGAEADLEPPLG